MVKFYIPQKGDLVILTFDPQAGHEQRGRRPALVVSNEKFNKAVGFCLVCPITSKDRDFPFHVKFAQTNISGYIITEQIKSVDYKARKIQYIEKLSKDILQEVEAIIDTFR